MDPSDAVESGVTPTSVDAWPQPFGTADHAGVARPELRGMRIVSQIPQDFNANAEIASNGFLQKHEGSPLFWGDLLIVPTSDGFTDVDHEETTRYHVVAYSLTEIEALAPGVVPTPVWVFDSGFVTVDAAVCSFGCMTNGYVQAFNAAIGVGGVGGKFVYAMGPSGTLDQLSLATGARIAVIDPFFGSSLDGDARLTVDAAPTVAPDGSVFYTATAWPLDASPFGKQPRGSWLVKVAPNGAVQIRDWNADNTVKLAGAGVVSLPQIPRATDLCEFPFGTRGVNPLTGPDSVPPRFGCGAQRPALNAPVAVAHDGSLVAVSYANNARGQAFLVTINPNTLAPIRTADLRDNHQRYGCGVRLSLDFPGCDTITAHGTTNIGVDPAFGGSVRARTPDDILGAAPTVAPDGSMAWTWYDGGFVFDDPGTYDSRGAGTAYRADATFLAANSQFGFDLTFGAQPSSSGFSWVGDRNLYNEGDLGIARYSPTFQVQAIGNVPSGLFLDTVDKNVLFDPAGDVYSMAESGFYYKFGARGQVLEALALTPDPVSVMPGYQAANGRYHAVSYAGSVFLIGSSSIGPGPQQAIAGRTTAALARGQAAKRAALASTPEPGPPSDNVPVRLPATALHPLTCGAGCITSFDCLDFGCPGTECTRSTGGRGGFCITADPVRAGIAPRASVDVPAALKMAADPETICAGGPCQIGAFGNALCTVTCGASAVCASAMRGCAVHIDGTMTPQCGGNGFGTCVVQDAPL